MTQTETPPAPCRCSSMVRQRYGAVLQAARYALRGGFLGKEITMCGKKSLVLLAAVMLLAGAAVARAADITGSDRDGGVK